MLDVRKLLFSLMDGWFVLYWPCKLINGKLFGLWSFIHNTGSAYYTNTYFYSACTLVFNLQSPTRLCVKTSPSWFELYGLFSATFWKIITALKSHMTCYNLKTELETAFHTILKLVYSCRQVSETDLKWIQVQIITGQVMWLLRADLSKSNWKQPGTS